MCTHFRILISKVLSFTPQSNIWIWQRRGKRKTSLSVMKRKNMMKFWQFQNYLCWQKKVCVVLKFHIYYVWLQGIIRTSLPMTWQISGSKSLLLTTTTTTTPPKPCTQKYSLATTGRGEQLDIGRSNLPEGTKIFPQHILWFKKLFLLGGNEVDKFVAFIFIFYWPYKRDTRPQNK